MAPFYKYLCDEYKWSMDTSLMMEMEKENSEQLKVLDAAIKGLSCENRYLFELIVSFLPKSNFVHRCRGEFWRD